MERRRNLGRGHLGYVRLGKLYVLSMVYVSLLHIMYTYIYVKIAPFFVAISAFRLHYSGVYTHLCVFVLFMLVFSVFLSRQLKRQSIQDLFLSLLLICYYLPGLTLYIYGNWNTRYLLFNWLSALLLSIWNELLCAKKGVEQSRDFSAVERLPGLLYVFSVFLSLSVIVIVTYYKGFSLHVDLSPDYVYSLRRDARLSAVPGVFSYYLAYASYIIPMLFLLNVKKRNLLPSCLLVLSQLNLFTFNGSKHVLFSLFLTVPFILFSWRITFKRILQGYLIFCLLAAGEVWLTDASRVPLLTAYTVRRFAFEPAQIGFFHFDFCLQYGYLYYSESLLRLFVDYPYDISFSNVIANYAYGIPDMGANTGMCAEGFSQIGWLSLLVYPIAYVAVFKIFYIAFGRFQGCDSYVPLLPVLLYVSTFMNGALQTVLLTFGLLPLLLTVIILFTYDGTKRCGAES